MRKAAQAPVATNVLPFPERCAVAAAMGRRKYCKAKRSNVLPFTGKKIENIDGPANLPGWKRGMVEALTKAMDQVLHGDTSGLLLFKTTGFPVDDEVMAGTVSICGTLSADPGALGRQVRWIEEKAREMAKDSLIRWV